MSATENDAVLSKDGVIGVGGILRKTIVIIVESFTRITTLGDRRVTASGDVRITAGTSVMADVKIHDLTLAGSISDTMQFETDIGGTTANKVTAAQLKAASQVNMLNLTTDDTDDITEGATNLFYTDTRADARVAAAVGVSVQGYSAVLAGTTASFTTAQETKLAGIEAGADVTDATNVAAAGAIMDGDFTSNGLMKRTGAGTYGVAVSGTDYQGVLSEGAFVNGDKTKLDGIAAGAEVNTIESIPTGITGADQITNIVSLTTAEYAAIGTKNASTIYVITDAT